MALSISSPGTEYRHGSTAVGPLEITATGETGTVNWSTDSGIISPATGLVAILSPFNRTELVTVTAEDDTDTVIKQIQIWGTLPVQPKWGVESDVDDETEISLSEDNTPKFRVVSELTARWPMIYEKREYAEYWDLLSFYAWHRKSKPFYVDDIALGDLLKVYFDSAIRRVAHSADYIDYAFQLRSYIFSVPPTPTTGPFAGIEYGIGEFG